MHICRIIPRLPRLHAWPKLTPCGRPTTVGPYTARWEIADKLAAQIPSRVVIIDEVPVRAIDVPACLAANPSDVRLCAVPRSQDLGYGMGMIEKTAAAQTGVGVIDLTAGICPG